jgi:diguanylate cyclase (GGDEF)-like protein
MTQLSTSRYEIRRLLGEGGMGRVSLAFDTLEGREVALKQILAADASAAAFKQEFWWMTRLKHPLLVEVFDFGTDEAGRPYFTMEVVEGDRLDAQLPLAPDQVKDALKQICRALRHIHHQGLVHGDLKPENIRVTAGGALKLMDFGLMTAAGQVATVSGTPAYMAPEVIQRARVDQRADLYALGVIAYQLLTGRLPFEEAGTAALLRAHLEESALPPSRFAKGVDAQWDRLVLRLLAKEPNKRPASAAEVLEALGEAVHDEAGTLLISPFVGRDDELEAIDALVADLAARRPGRTLTFAGAAGVGKTRLLDEAAFKAQLAEAKVFRGAAGAVGGTPYEPFMQVLRQAWPELSRSESELLAIHEPALATLLPDLATGVPGHRLEPLEEKLRLQGAIAELFTAVARKHGLVLILDNWHAADALSKELLGVLQRQLADAPVLMLLATQQADIDTRALLPLTRLEVSRMMAAMLGVESVPAPFLIQIAELTAGAPAAVESLLAHLVANGKLPRQQGRWVLDALSADALPAGIADLIADRLDRLAPVSRRVLELAAVLGRAFDLALLARLLPDVAAEGLYEAVAELEIAQLLTHHAGGYQAGQAHLAEALLRGLEPARLKGLHTMVAEALEEAVDGQPGDDQAVRLAYHFLEGERPNKAVIYAFKAAQRLAELYDNAQAQSLLGRGLALMADQPDAPLTLRLDYLSLRGDLHRGAAEGELAEACYQEALPLAESQSRAEAIAHVRVGLGLLRQMGGQYEEALEQFRLAIPACRDSGIAREELRCLAAMGRVYYYAGDVARSQATYEEALARAREAADLAYVGESLGFLGVLHVSAEPVPGQASQVAKGLTYLHEAIGIKEAVGDKRGLNDSFMLLGNAQLHLGDLPGADHSFSRNQAICREIGAVEDEIFSHLNLALVATERGQHLAALAHLKRVRDLGEPRDAQFAIGLGACLEARALVSLGQLKQPLVALEDSLVRSREAENRYWELFALNYLIETLMRVGQFEAAQAMLLESLNAEAETGIHEFALQHTLAKGTLAMRQGQLEPAESALRDALSRAEAKQALVIEAQACLGLAELANLTGESREAARWADRAAEQAEAADAQGLLAEARYMQGLAAAAHGDMGVAEARFADALEAAERLNLLDLMARATHRRAVAKFPSPQAQKLLKKAQDLMVQQVDSLELPYQEAFLAAEGRYAIFMGELPAQAAATVVESGFVEDPDAARQLANAHEAIAQQRLWIDELQDGCELLMKQLDFSQAIARTTDPTFAMNHALTLALEITRAERGEVFLLEGKRLVPRAKKTTATLDRIDEDWTHYAEALELAISSGEVQYVGDTTHQRRSYGSVESPRAVMILPLADEHLRVGAMLILGHPDESGALVKREIEAVKVLASQLSASLRNIRMQSEWREKTQRLEMLYMLSSSVTSTLVMEEVLDLVVKLSLQITQADRGFLLLLDDDGELDCKAARHIDGPMDFSLGVEPYSRSICRKVLESGEAIAVEDTLDDAELRNQKSIMDLNLRTVMCVPLKVKSKHLGVLYVDSRVVVNTFTERDLDLLKSIASHASIALENAHLYHLATVDKLTNLYFRSHFEQRMKEEIQRAQRYGSSLSLLMMDIDHFKKFNDTYGHAVGDEVLRHVAGVIKTSVRQDLDIPCRYGGEEMVVLLPETDEVGAAIFAERIRKSVDEALVDTHDHKGLHVTISIGVATIPKMATTSLELMERADMALYASKRGGRNQVTVYAPGQELKPGE